MARLYDTGIYSASTSAGAVGAGWKLNFYTTGTSTRKNTYTTSALSVANANPVVADANGRWGPIWLTGGDYKVVLTDENDVVIVTRDPAESNYETVLSGTGGAALVGSTGPSTVQADITARPTSATLAATGGSALIGHKSSLTNSTATTVYASVNSRKANAKADFGCTFDNSTDDITALTTAVNALSTAGGGTLELPIGTAKIGSTLTLPANVYLDGQGPQGTRISATTAGDFALIRRAGSSGSVINRGGVRNLTLIGGGKTLTNAIGIKDEWSNRSEYENIHFHACRNGMYASNVWQCKWDFLQAHGSGSDQNYIGFYMAEVDPANQNNAVIATGCLAQGVDQFGWRLINFNGSKFTSCEGLDGVNAWYLGDPSTGTEAVRWGHFTNCLGDTSSSHNWRIEKGSATSIKQIQFTGCWAGTSSGATNVYIGGASELVFSNWQAVSANAHAFHFYQSSRCSLTGSSLRDWNGAVGGNAGVRLEDSSVISITGNQIYTGTLGTGKAVIESGTSNNNLITGNNLLGGTTITGGATTSSNNNTA